MLSTQTVVSNTNAPTSLSLYLSLSAMEESVQLIGGSGGGNGNSAAGREGKCVMAAKSSPATAVIIIGDNSGEGEADDEGDDSDYPPRKFKKYRSIADVYQSTKPLQIVKATPAKRHCK